MSAMNIYMEEIEGLGRISRKDEELLADMLEHGTEEERNFAVEELVCSNLRLVVKIAHDFTKDKTVDIEDLVAWGNIGLLRAAQRFKSGMGAKFSTHASWWIKQAIKRYLDNKTLVRVPCTFNQKIKKTIRMMDEFEKKNGRVPTAEELSGLTGFTEEEIEDLLSKNPSFTSIDIEIGDEGSLHDVLASNSESGWDDEKEEMMKAVSEAIAHLEESERYIIVKRYGLDGTPPQKLDEISEKIGKTRERVRQIQNDTIRKIRRYIRKNERA